MGGIGSGRSREATDAVELLLAAVIRGDEAEAAKCVKKLDVAKRHGASKMSGLRVRQLMSRACSELNFEVETATANPKEHLGDIRVVLGDGSKVWLEVKGQTKKQRFTDLTQADYVRDGTDFLRSYAKATPKFDKLLTGKLRQELAMDQKLTFTSDWSLGELWMADLALLETEQKKRRAAVLSPDDLKDFMSNKYLIHLSMEGIRYLRISELRPVIAMQSGEKLQIELDVASEAKAAAIRLSVGVVPRSGTTDFTYHVGYKNSKAAGRHKLHTLAVSASPFLTVFK